MKKFILTIFLTIFCFAFLNGHSFASQEERVENFSAEISINKDGSINVVEKIDYYFPISKHGIYREIPKVKVNNDNKRFVMKFENITVKDLGGNTYPFSDSSTNQKVYLKIGDPNKTITGYNTYVISYKVSGSLTYFEDHDELYWNITGNEWQVPIKNVSARVVLPEEKSLESVCYTGAYGSSLQNCVVSNQGNISFITAANLGAGEGLTIASKFDKGVVAISEPKTDYSNVFANILGLILTFFIVVLGGAWYVYLPIKVFLNWRGDKKFTQQHEKIVAAWFDPPKNPDGSLYTAAETGALIDKSIDFKDITASIIQLAQKKYIKIHVLDKNDITFEKLKDYNDILLKPFERAILDGIFYNNQTTISIKKLKTSTKFAKSIQEFNTSLAKELETLKLFEKDFNKVRTNNTMLGSFGLFTGNLLLALSAFVFGRKSAKRTLLGVEKYSEARSLENFLKSQDTQLDYQAKNQMFFERLLPYATAFGVEDIWAKRFSDIQFTQSDWYDGNVNNAFLISAISSNINRTIGSSVAHANSSSSSGFSSGFSGGSSGGGGGGGGGGSW